MTLQKLLYYVQAWHLAIADKPLFSEQIKAWRDGPVVPQVWHARKDRATRRAKDQGIDTMPIGADASDLIDLVLMSYGSMSGDELSALTHVEAPWREARGGLPADAHSSNTISTESMAAFYRSHRRLGGRTASDLAAGGIHLVSPTPSGPVDVAAILAALGAEFSEPGLDVWGGANVDSHSAVNADGSWKERRRGHASA